MSNQVQLHARRRTVGRAALLGVLLAALLGACGRRDRLPVPPSSPPRPQTSAPLASVHKHVESAILILHRLPTPPRRGLM